MARFLISPEVLRAIQPLASIQSDKFRALLGELSESLVASLTIEADIAKRLNGIAVIPVTPAEREGLAEALVGLHYLRLAVQSDDELVAEVKNAWIENGTSAGEDRLATLEVNLRELLQIKVLRASIKALSLISDYDKLYVGGRIFTDVRPVFDVNVSDTMLASLVVHTLKISVREDGRPKTIYVAIDSQDLTELRETIDRALEKASVISNRIRSSAGGFGPALEHPYAAKVVK